MSYISCLCSSAQAVSPVDTAVTRLIAFERADHNNVVPWAVITSAGSLGLHSHLTLLPVAEADVDSHVGVAAVVRECFE